MKYLIPFLFISSAKAAFLSVDGYDQLKLAHFLRQLPASVAPSSEERFTGFRRVRTTFDRPAISIRCFSDYYAENVPSHSECVFEVDEHHQSLDKKYDEWRFPENSSGVASALFEIMPHGAATKSFRSGVFEQGTDFSGRRTNIFDFLFECTKTSCVYRLAEKKIQ